MTLLELIQAKRQHLLRLANQQGAAGEAHLLRTMGNWIPRPRGTALKTLLHALQEKGIIIKGTSFDFIQLPVAVETDFTNLTEVRKLVDQMIFIELKTSNQARVKPDFSGFFFALSESEIAASEVLGLRHKVVLYNNVTQDLLETSVPVILARAKSSTWQLSVQL